MDNQSTKKINKEIREAVLRFGRVLSEQGIPIEKLILFGSYAKNEATKDSDIDICVVSPVFGKDHIDEMQFLFKQTRKVDTRIEPVPASPQRYAERVSPLMWEIRKYGIEVR